jgi:protease II
MFGVVDVSPDENILVYSVDTCGAEQYAPSLF